MDVPDVAVESRLGLEEVARHLRPPRLGHGRAQGVNRLGRAGIVEARGDANALGLGAKRVVGEGLVLELAGAWHDGVLLGGVSGHGMNVVVMRCNRKGHK